MFVPPVSLRALPRALEALAAGGESAVLRRQDGAALLVRLQAGRIALEDPALIRSRHVIKDRKGGKGCIINVRGEFWCELAKMPLHVAMTPQDIIRELKARLSKRGQGTKFDHVEPKRERIAA